MPDYGPGTLSVDYANTIGRTKFALQPGREMVVTGNVDRSELAFRPDVCVIDTGDERVTTDIPPRT